MKQQRKAVESKLVTAKQGSCYYYYYYYYYHYYHYYYHYYHYYHDIIIVERDTVYIFELTVGFETNISTNSERKKNNYSQLLEDLKSRYKKVKFINLSMGAIGIYGDTCFNLKSVLKHLGLNENEVNHLLRKLCNICIRATYFIFCK